MQMQQEKLTNKQKKFRILGPCSLEFQAANTGSWRLERPTVKKDVCIGCGICSLYCPTDCITVHKGDKEMPVEIDWYYCKGCGICANECPKQCMTMIAEREEQNAD